MKRLIAIVCLIMAMIANAMAQRDVVPVILTAGQSNADGRGAEILGQRVYERMKDVILKNNEK